MLSEVALSDDGIDARLEQCVAYANETKALKGTPDYEKRIESLKELSSDTSRPDLMAMAESILEELEIDSSAGLIQRDQIELALAADANDFMGGDQRYVRMEDALVDEDDAATVLDFRRNRRRA